MPMTRADKVDVRTGLLVQFDRTARERGSLLHGAGRCLSRHEVRQQCTVRLSRIHKKLSQHSCPFVTLVHILRRLCLFYTSS